MLNLKVNDTINIFVTFLLLELFESMSTHVQSDSICCSTAESSAFSGASSLTEPILDITNKGSAEECCHTPECMWGIWIDLLYSNNPVLAISENSYSKDALLM